MQIKFDAGKVKTCLDEMQKSLTNMHTAIIDYEPVAHSLDGSSGEWTGPVNGNLRDLKKEYQKLISATKPLVDWIKNVEAAYADALSSVTSLGGN